MKVAEFTLPSVEEREARRRELEEQLLAAKGGLSGSSSDVDDGLPGAPDLDALADGSDD